MLRSFFFQAEDGIRDGHVTGVQTCALPDLGVVAHHAAPDDPGTPEAHHSRRIVVLRADRAESDRDPGLLLLSRRVQHLAQLHGLGSGRPVPGVGGARELRGPLHRYRDLARSEERRVWKEYRFTI